MSRAVGRPQQHLHDNKTNCSLGSRIQNLLFNIYSSTCSDLNFAQKLWKSKCIWNFLLFSHNIRGQTARQQVCGHDPIETNFQSAIWLLVVEGRLRNLTKLRNSATFPAYCLSAPRNLCGFIFALIKGHLNFVREKSHKDKSRAVGTIFIEIFFVPHYILGNLIFWF